ncbi:reverse transcriptase-like protein [Salmonella enterica subsp. enterica serovar Typhimurium]|nr:reverse transcriptase-like protein [Salmonella enterica subsp. enterica serovar Typhimurium]
MTLGFKASTNEAEYEALLASLRMARDLAVKKLEIHSDSQLITSQTTGKYTVKHSRIAQYLEKVRKQLEAF